MCVWCVCVLCVCVCGGVNISLFRGTWVSSIIFPRCCGVGGSRILRPVPMIEMRTPHPTLKLKGIKSLTFDSRFKAFFDK